VKPCRCLLRELSDADAYKSVFDYVSLVPLKLRTDPKELEKRLEACKQCESLANGICRICGCFVEARASKKPNRCPGAKDMWGSLS
jgi:hypothetical protein